MAREAKVIGKIGKKIAMVSGMDMTAVKIGIWIKEALIAKVAEAAMAK